MGSDLTKLGIIGSGPSSIYLLNNILQHLDTLKNQIQTIFLFERENIAGMGMPYNPVYTDIYNLANISSEEIPLLEKSYADWLRTQDEEKLKSFNILERPISESKVYSRVSLGHYFRCQYNRLIKKIGKSGISVVQHDNCQIEDILKINNSDYLLTDSNANTYPCSSIVIATGHAFNEPDHVSSGYYSSPWPIHKILPRNKELFNFSIGTLGASLSAFDVVTSLSHRHGTFTREGGHLKYFKHGDVPNFKIVLHSAEGWLPHLQYEQVKPIREIYRHFGRENILRLIDRRGHLDIHDYFDAFCRKALMDALTKDGIWDVVEKLNKNCGFKEFIEAMAEKHDFINSFEGMKAELNRARDKMGTETPVHWMETLDDLMYSLNYHAELLSAEDHIFFHGEVMPFLMNVIAALPLQSAEILLALYDSGCIELKKGRVELKEDSFTGDGTIIYMKSETEPTLELKYRMFIDCSGGKKFVLEDFPFKSLVKNETICPASASFSQTPLPRAIKEKYQERIILTQDKQARLELSGIQIDSGYMTIDRSGNPNFGLYDINFTHTSGLRPYSYGLQACNATSLILVETWVNDLERGKNNASSIKNVTKIYDDTTNL